MYTNGPRGGPGDIQGSGGWYLEQFKAMLLSLSGVSSLEDIFANRDALMIIVLKFF